MVLEKIKHYIPYIIKYRRELIIGLISLLFADIAGLLIPWILKSVIDILPNNPSSLDLARFCGALFTAAIIQALSRFGWRKFLFGASRKVEFDISNKLFNPTLNLKFRLSINTGGRLI